jgi:hypothetical protein
MRVDRDSGAAQDDPMKDRSTADKKDCRERREAREETERGLNEQCVQTSV